MQSPQKYLLTYSSDFIDEWIGTYTNKVNTLDRTSAVLP